VRSRRDLAFGECDGQKSPQNLSPTLPDGYRELLEVFRFQNRKHGKAVAGRGFQLVQPSRFKLDNPKADAIAIFSRADQNAYRINPESIRPWAISIAPDG